MDIEISDDGETFVATVTYDTKKLYGKVEATREIKVKKQAEQKEKKKLGEKADLAT
jgi:hypothetical protein